MVTVEQKNEIKKQKQLLDRLKKEAEVERVRAQAEARKRVLLEFERGQIGLGLGSTKLTSTSGSAKGDNNGAEKAGKEGANPDDERMGNAHSISHLLLTFDNRFLLL